MTSDFERKLVLKADQRELTKAIPDKMDNIIRGLTMQLTDMKVFAIVINYDNMIRI